MASMTEFGEKIDKILKEKGLKDSDLAKKMDVKPPQIFALKHKTKNPRDETLKAVAKALGKPVDFFLKERSATTQGERVAPPGGWAPVKRGAAVNSQPKSKRANSQVAEEHAEQERAVASAVVESAPGEIQLTLDGTEDAPASTQTEPRSYSGRAASAGEAAPLKVQEKNSQESTAETMELKVFVSFELNGKVISRKQISKLPPDFEF